jgi:predicted MFS family arabinose efflux permease
MFTAGLALFATASAACALAPDAGSLIAARAVLSTIWRPCWPPRA